MPIIQPTGIVIIWRAWPLLSTRVQPRHFYAGQLRQTASAWKNVDTNAACRRKSSSCVKLHAGKTITEKAFSFAFPLPPFWYFHMLIVLRYFHFMIFFSRLSTYFKSSVKREAISSFDLMVKHQQANANHWWIALMTNIVKYVSAAGYFYSPTRLLWGRKLPSLTVLSATLP